MDPEYFLCVSLGFQKGLKYVRPIIENSLQNVISANDPPIVVTVGKTVVGSSRVVFFHVISMLGEAKPYLRF